MYIHYASLNHNSTYGSDYLHVYHPVTEPSPTSSTAMQIFLSSLEIQLRSKIMFKELPDTKYLCICFLEKLFALLQRLTYFARLYHHLLLITIVRLVLVDLMFSKNCCLTLHNYFVKKKHLCIIIIALEITTIQGLTNLS